jgi:hypothetical protein
VQGVPEKPKVAKIATPAASFPDADPP